MLYKTIIGGYVNNISKNSGGTEITETEYSAILDAIRNCPTAPDGYSYRLQDDMMWELYELTHESADFDDDEISAEEAYNIIMGVIE